MNKRDEIIADHERGHVSQSDDYGSAHAAFKQGAGDAHGMDIQCNPPKRGMAKMPKMPKKLRMPKKMMY